MDEMVRFRCSPEEFARWQAWKAAQGDGYRARLWALLAADAQPRPPAVDPWPARRAHQALWRWIGRVETALGAGRLADLDLPRLRRFVAAHPDHAARLVLEVLPCVTDLVAFRAWWRRDVGVWPRG